MTISRHSGRMLMPAALLGALAACGGGDSGGGSNPPPVSPVSPVTYALSGAVTGLDGTLVLQLNGANDRTITSNGTVTLAASLASGASYAVTVRTQPSAPVQACTVANGSGTISGNVSNVTITCVTVPLTLSGSTPSAGATGIARNVAPVLTFSAPLDPATVIPAYVTLDSATGNHPAALGASGGQITVTPAGNLLPLTAYTLTATAAVRGSSGEQMAGAAAVNFTTQDGAWHTASAVENNIGSPGSVQIAFDAAGNALAVWHQSAGSSISIWSSRYTAGSGWDVAQLIEGNSGEALSPQIAVDAAGNALAVWRQQDDGARYSIWSNRYTAGSGWGVAQLIELESGDAISPRIAVDAAGNALAVWSQTDGNRYNIWSNRYTAGSGWGFARAIETENAGDANYPTIAFDATGNALAVWWQHDGTQFNIWSNRYAAGSGWGVAQLIEGESGNAYSRQIAVDAAGNALAVWVRTSGAQYSIWANRYTAGSGWSVAQPIWDNSGEASTPGIAVDATGNALAIWRQHVGAQYNIWSNRYTAGSGWGVAQLIEGEPGAAYDPQIAVDATGNGLAVWEQYDVDGARYSIWANRYTAGSGWGVAQPIQGNSGGTNYPQIAVDAAGNGLAVWQQPTSNSRQIWSNRFD